MSGISHFQQCKKKVLDIFAKVCYNTTEIPPKNVYTAVQCATARTLHHQKIRERSRILGTLFQVGELYDKCLIVPSHKSRSLVHFCVETGLQAC